MVWFVCQWSDTFCDRKAMGLWLHVDRFKISHMAAHSSLYNLMRLLVWALDRWPHSGLKTLFDPMNIKCPRSVATNEAQAAAPSVTFTPQLRRVAVQNVANKTQIGLTSISSIFLFALWFVQHGRMLFFVKRKWGRNLSKIIKQVNNKLRMYGKINIAEIKPLLLTGFMHVSTGDVTIYLW